MKIYVHKVFDLEGHKVQKQMCGIQDSKNLNTKVKSFELNLQWIKEQDRRQDLAFLRRQKEVDNLFITETFSSLYYWIFKSIYFW